MINPLAVTLNASNSSLLVPSVHTRSDCREFGMVGHMDCEGFLVDAMLCLRHHDPVHEKRCTCSVKVFATSFRSKGQA